MLTKPAVATAASYISVFLQPTQVQPGGSSASPIAQREAHWLGVSIAILVNFSMFGLFGPWVFPKIRNPQIDGFLITHESSLMIWGYPHFDKHQFFPGQPDVLVEKLHGWSLPFCEAPGSK